MFAPTIPIAQNEKRGQGRGVSLTSGQVGESHSTVWTEGPMTPKKDYLKGVLTA
jgi:hypothetical protein